MTVARELAAAAELAQELAVWAMDQMLPETIARWDTKAHAADVVTDLDLSIERHVREEISRRFPQHAIIGEEYDDRPGSGFTWYCDPVDGTTNFAHGIGWHAFCLAMADEQARSSASWRTRAHGRCSAPCAVRAPAWAIGSFTSRPARSSGAPC